MMQMEECSKDTAQHTVPSKKKQKNRKKKSKSIKNKSQLVNVNECESQSNTTESKSLFELPELIVVQSLPDEVKTIDDMKKLSPTTSKEHLAETRRLSKQLEKQKLLDKSRNLEENQPDDCKPDNVVNDTMGKIEKTREQILAERELKKQAKLAIKKKGKSSTDSTQSLQSQPVAVISGDLKNSGTQSEIFITKKLDELTVSMKSNVEKATTTTKAERRAKQEAQRAAKAKLLEEKTSTVIGAKSPKTPEIKETNKIEVKSPLKKTPTTVKVTPHRVKLFNHLYNEHQNPNFSVISGDIHPAIVKLGVQYASRVIVGANARCLSFMSAIREVIQDYRTPPQKEFTRGLEEHIQPGLTYLHRCRPLAVSVSNAVKFIKWQITQLPTDESDFQLKERLIESIGTYIRDQIEKAAQAISISVQEKISNGDVILTFGCSSLITHILQEAQSRQVDFRVIVVNARPDNEGQVMLERLVSKGIRCSFVMINAIGFIMPEVTKVLLGAHALLANGYVMARTGTAQVALVAKTYNVPVLVCCETHKFSERVQTDAFVYNELGNPSDIVLKSKEPVALANWESLQHLTPLNLKYDITPPELVTAVVTEVAILPCTSVPVILRIKPSEIGY